MNVTSPTVLDQAYLNLRREFGRVPLIKSKLPEFVRRCESLGEFWSFSKAKHGTYQARREYIWDSLRSLLEYLKAEDRSPGVEPISEILAGGKSNRTREILSVSRRGILKSSISTSIGFHAVHGRYHHRVSDWPTD